MSLAVSVLNHELTEMEDAKEMAQEIFKRFEDICQKAINAGIPITNYKPPTMSDLCVCTQKQEQHEKRCVLTKGKAWELLRRTTTRTVDRIIQTSLLRNPGDKGKDPTRATAQEGTELYTWHPDFDGYDQLGFRYPIYDPSAVIYLNDQCKLRNPREREPYSGYTSTNWKVLTTTRNLFQGSASQDDVAFYRVYWHQRNRTREILIDFWNVCLGTKPKNDFIQEHTYEWNLNPDNTEAIDQEYGTWNLWFFSSKLNHAINHYTKCYLTLEALREQLSKTVRFFID